MSKKPVAEKILAYLRKHPGIPAKDIAESFGVNVSYIYNLRKRIKDEQAVWTPPDLLPVPEAPATTSVDNVLDDRAKDYGKFIEGAEIMQMLKRLVHNYIEDRGTPLAFDQREAIDMIIHKLGRIINGNPDKVDHWVDVAGYAKLVADRLEGNAR